MEREGTPEEPLPDDPTESVPDEAPVADVLEQRLTPAHDEHLVPEDEELDGEGSEADRVDQRTEVDWDDEDVRE